MRPLIRRDAYLAAVPGGMYALTHHGPMHLAGASVSRWVERLAPRLDGRHTLAELVAPLSAPRCELVTRLVTTLRDRGVVLDLDQDGPALVGAAESGQFDLAFVDSFRGQAAGAVAGYRDRTVLVTGTGPLLPALARAVSATGVRRIRVTVLDGQLADPAAFTASLDGVDLVLHAAGPHQWSRAEVVDRCCARARVTLAQLLAGAGELWLVPPTRPGVAGHHAGWLAARPRLAGADPAPATPTGRQGPPDQHGLERDDMDHNSDYGGLDGGLDSGLDGGLDEVAATAAASQLVQRTFCQFTGVDQASTSRPQLTRLDPRTLRSSRLDYLPHPFARPAGTDTEDGFLARLHQLRGLDRLTDEEFSERAARCAGDRLGLFELGERDWAQIPLHVSEAVLTAQAGQSGTSRPLAYVGAGFSYLVARCRAASQALARYGAHLLDRRRLVDGSAWGVELDAPDRLRLVPAGVAFPELATPAAPARWLAGVAAGYDWDEAVTRGLLAQCRRITIAQVRRAAAPYPQVDLAGARLDRAGARGRDLLAELGQLPRAYDVTGALGVPTVALCRDTATVAYATGTTMTQAMSDGLLQVLRAVQANVHGQPAYAPEPVPHLPVWLRGEAAWPADDWPVVPVPTIAAGLRAIGRIAVAVPLDHDPEVMKVLPFLVNVVVLNA